MTISQKPFAEGTGGDAKAKAGDIGIDIERTLRLCVAHPDCVQSFANRSTSLVVGLTHFLNAILTTRHRGKSRVLADGGSRDCKGVVHLRHWFDQRTRSGKVANAPAGHGIRLRKPTKRDRALFHSGQRGHGNNRVIAKGQTGINLIRDDDQIVLLGQFSDFLDFIRWGDGTSGVIGIDQH